jgi:hypothetical protein
MNAIVFIEWADAHQATDGWTAIEDLEDDGERIIHTVGFLLPVDEGGKEDHVTIVQSFDVEQEMVDNVLHVPSSMVRKMKVVTFDLLSGAFIAS